MYADARATRRLSALGRWRRVVGARRQLAQRTSEALSSRRGAALRRRWSEWCRDGLKLRAVRDALRRHTKLSSGEALTLALSRWCGQWRAEHSPSP